VPLNRPRSSMNHATGVLDGGEGGEYADEVCAAAHAVGKSTFLLIAGGAGLSSDSGLCTFQEMTAKLQQTLRTELSYDQAAGSDMMCKDPAVFYGFWFQSMHTYAAAQPHEGYKILREWCQDVTCRAKSRMGSGTRALSNCEPHFSITSNIDCFFQRSGIAGSGSLAQIHGCIQQWQCGGVPSGKKYPLFIKDRCSDTLYEAPRPEGCQENLMPYQYPPPQCPKCSEGWLRPHVYLFGDGKRFIEDDDTIGTEAFSKWKTDIVLNLATSTNLHLTILEIGCGLRVPRIRKLCEELLMECPKGQCDLVRINPEFERQPLLASPTVSIRRTALEALKAIHQKVLELRLTSADCMPVDHIHLPMESDVQKISIRAGSRPMLLVVISDTHSLHSNIPEGTIPDGDVLIHCGDFTKRGTAHEIESFNSFMGKMPHKTKLVIAGNHDIGPFCDFDPRKAESLLSNVRYLNNEMINIDGLSFYGSPWDRRGSRCIPKGVDVLITHDPPQGILDAGHGCQYLKQEVIAQLPRLHVFGHIHEAHGFTTSGGCTFVNAAMANNGMVAKCIDKTVTVISVIPLE